MTSKVEFGQVRTFIGSTPGPYDDRVGLRFIVQEPVPVAEDEDVVYFIRWEDGWIEDCWKFRGRDSAMVVWIQEHSVIVKGNDDR